MPLSKREQALQRIKFYGYHEDSKWLFYAIDNRISRPVAKEWYLKGRAARESGVLCNCQECKAKQPNA